MSGARQCRDHAVARRRLRHDPPPEAQRFERFSRGGAAEEAPGFAMV